MTARTHHRQPVRRQVRAAKTGAARDALGQLTHGCEIYCLTFGQFSLIDALTALLEQTGPADVVLSTWTAAAADLTQIARKLEHGGFRSLRFIVDRSFITRQPAYCARMRELFGDDCIRTCRTHAKFATIRNEAWSLAIRTSMNLNENPRLESLEISDDAGLCGFLCQIADEIFAEQAPGEFNGQEPRLAGIPDARRPPIARLGKVSTGRTVRTGPR